MTYKKTLKIENVFQQRHEKTYHSYYSHHSDTNGYVKWTWKAINRSQ